MIIATVVLATIIEVIVVAVTGDIGGQTLDGNGDVPGVVLGALFGGDIVPVNSPGSVLIVFGVGGAVHC